LALFSANFHLYALKVVILNPVKSFAKSVSIPATGKAGMKTDLCKIGVSKSYKIHVETV
jgi:hypothetical protein